MSTQLRPLLSTVFAQFRETSSGGKSIFSAFQCSTWHLWRSYQQRVLSRRQLRACQQGPQAATPRIGVSAVVWRLPEEADGVLTQCDLRLCAQLLTGRPFEAAECLLVQRTKQPARGAWSFPGGGLLYGERVLDGIARELNEETGLKSSDLILRSEYEVVEYIDAEWHYVILAATGFARHDASPRPGDDARQACWVSVRHLIDPNFQCTPGCSDTVERVWKRLAQFAALEMDTT
ncbi:hypothetical protein CCYA_CCYA13G3577 [Cyanidiococcus yangmingshanensis]|nr:hypothetical protein CCYA_CCYA13G3577 [Cyanidiococcus yangmingshanensis]